MLKVAVIGLGFIGEIHARILYESPHAQLVLIVDNNLERAKELGKRFDCAYAVSLTEGYKLVQVDAVSICTPDVHHLNHVREAADLKLDILLEKPIAANVEEAEEIIAICEQAQVRLMIGHLLHFDPRYAILREKIHAGDLGDIIHMNFRRTNPRANSRRLKGKISIMQYIGIHDFEMMCAYMRGRPVRVYAQKVSKLNQDIATEDTIISMITFDNGGVGLVELSWGLPDNASLGIGSYAQVVGTKSLGIVDIHNQGVAIVNEKEVLYPDTLHWPEYNGQIHGDLKEEINHFVLGILNEKPFITDLASALQALVIVDACKQSIESNQPVEL